MTLEQQLKQALKANDELEHENAHLRDALENLVAQCKSGDDITAWWRAAVERADSALANTMLKAPELETCNAACAEWVKQSANLWMHRPRGGWPVALRKAYEAVHAVSVANAKMRDTPPPANQSHE